MFADAGRADREVKCFFFFYYSVCSSLENKLCGVFVLFFLSPTYTDRLTFQSMVVKAVMVGCKTSFCQSVHTEIDITLHTAEFVFLTRLL